MLSSRLFMRVGFVDLSCPGYVGYNGVSLVVYSTWCVFCTAITSSGVQLEAYTNRNSTSSAVYVARGTTYGIALCVFRHG